MNQPMINFYAIVSARYEVMEDQWISSNNGINNPVDLEIYYHKGHEYNLDRMMESMKESFDYYSANFSPYPYEQMRIMEFPRYAEFAQSFPNTVPFSEGIGFMLDIDDKEDVDMSFYITAHELAHQWWGLQVEAANVQGQLMILETLAQYSALMVLKQKYPKEKVEQFLKLQLRTYLDGKVREEKQELPLVLVENQDYIYYAKGAINMYALQDYIGEDKVNLALKRFIKDWNSIDNFATKNRYATTEDLLKYFREVTPENLQHVITDLFEKTTTPSILTSE
jgi:aminopeptidase N